MSKFREPTLDDIYGAGKAVLNQSTQAAVSRKFREPTLDEVTGKQKKEEPFEEGSTLQVLSPVGENFDTGIPLGKTASQFLAGAGKTYADVGRRAKQVMLRPGAQEDIDESARLDKPLMETTAGMLGSMAPSVVAGMPVANTARAAGLFGLANGLMTPTTSEEGLGSEFLNPALGAIGGAGGQKVMNAVTNAAGKVANVLPRAAYSALPAAAQRFATRHGLPKPDLPFENAEDEATVALLDRLGVRHSIGDVQPRSMFRSFEDATEPLGLGRRGFLEGQQDDLKSMLEATRTGINKPIVDQATGQVVPDNFAMAKGLKDQYAANKVVARDMFNDVGKLAEQPGVKPIIPANTYHEAQRLMAERPDFFEELQKHGMWKKLAGVERDAGPQNSIIVQQNGQPFQKAQQLDFNEVKALRSRLGSEWNSAKSQDREKARVMATLLRALDDDLDMWGQDTGNAALNNAYGKARSYYKKNVVPYTDPEVNPSKSPIFSNVAFKDKIDSETLPRGVFKEDRSQLAQDFMDLSNPTGQQAGKNELINEIIGAGLNPDTETGLSNAMIRHSTRYKAPGSAVFSPSEQQAVADSVEALKHTRRAAQLQATPPKTGFRSVPWAAGSALMGGAGVPLYYGLNATMGDQLTPSERVATAFILAPLTALAAAKGASAYSHGAAGKALHFADPNITAPVLGGLQRAVRGTGKGIGYGLQNEYRRGALGHRVEED